MLIAWIKQKYRMWKRVQSLKQSLLETKRNVVENVLRQAGLPEDDIKRAVKSCQL